MFLAGDGHDVSGRERGVDAAFALLAEVEFEDLLAKFRDGLLGDARGGRRGRLGVGAAAAGSADAEEVLDDAFDLAGAEVLEGNDADVLDDLGRTIDDGQDALDLGHVLGCGAGQGRH